MDVYEVLEKTVTGLGYELVDVERSPRGRVLRVYIDRQEKPGGVDIDDCVLVSNQLSRVLAVEGVDYDRLEVSSPGLDRPLRREADFVRFAGSAISLRLHVALSGRRNFSGVLRGVLSGKVIVQTDVGGLQFDLANIEKARLVPRFETPKSSDRLV